MVPVKQIYCLTNDIETVICLRSQWYSLVSAYLN